MQIIWTEFVPGTKIWSLWNTKMSNKQWISHCIVISGTSAGHEKTSTGYTLESECEFILKMENHDFNFLLKLRLNQIPAERQWRGEFDLLGIFCKTLSLFYLPEAKCLLFILSSLVSDDFDALGSPGRAPPPEFCTVYFISRFSS